MKYKKNIISDIYRCYPQEKDWTGIFACIRTLLTVPPAEDVLSKDVKPGIRFSNDIVKSGILDTYDTKFGCKEPEDLDGILDLMESGYNVAVGYNSSRWIVLLGYYPMQNGGHFLVYDPGIDEMYILQEEFLGYTWGQPDGEMSDYIAIRE